MHTPTILIEKATSLLTGLRPLYKFKDYSVNELKVKILQIFTAYPDFTSYDICWKTRLGMENDHGWIRKQVSDLAEIGLIERAQKDHFEHGKKPCRLTIAGLVYLIMRKDIMYNDVIKGILMNYNNSELFQLFVHPYIKQDTLYQLTSFNTLSPLSLYLSDCCNVLINAVNTIVTAKEKYVTEEIFVWQSVPDDKYATDRLRVFLKKEFNLKWMDYARFEKMDDSRLIISYKAGYVLIQLNRTKSKALLTMKGNAKFEFTVKQFRKKNEDSEEYIVVYVPRSTIEEMMANFLAGYTQSRVHSFICALMLSITIASDDFRTLGQDKIFLDTLGKTKEQFINKCDNILSTNFS